MLSHSLGDQKWLLLLLLCVQSSATLKGAPSLSISLMYFLDATHLGDLGRCIRTHDGALPNPQTSVPAAWSFLLHPYHTLFFRVCPGGVLSHGRPPRFSLQVRSAYGRVQQYSSTGTSLFNGNLHMGCVLISVTAAACWECTAVGWLQIDVNIMYTRKYIPFGRL